jgi:hypothetical protein
MNACGGGAPLSPPPEGASNPQPALHRACRVSAQNWWTGEHLCGGDASAPAEEREPLWLTALLLRVPEVFEIQCHVCGGTSTSLFEREFRLLRISRHGTYKTKHA